MDHNDDSLLRFNVGQVSVGCDRMLDTANNNILCHD